jgi:hypothetical protein
MARSRSLDDAATALLAALPMDREAVGSQEHLAWPVLEDRRADEEPACPDRAGGFDDISGGFDDIS